MGPALERSPEGTSANHLEKAPFIGDEEVPGTEGEFLEVALEPFFIGRWSVSKALIGLFLVQCLEFRPSRDSERRLLLAR